MDYDNSKIALHGYRTEVTIDDRQQIPLWIAITISLVLLVMVGFGLHCIINKRRKITLNERLKSYEQL